MKRFIPAAMLLLAISAPAWSTKVKVWTPAAPAQYEKAVFKHAVLTNQGAIRLARELKPLADIDAVHVWSVVEDKQGDLFAATGNEGKIFRIGGDGRAEVVFQAEDSQVLSLAAAGDGGVYAGTGPSGLIIHISPKGEAREFCKTGESYVWSLAFDAKNETLYAATGPKGKILRVDKEGKATVFYSTRQDHVLCVALGSDGQLYAGTSQRGLVYRVNAEGKGFVLLDAPQNEVRTLLVTADAVYAGTSMPLPRRAPGTPEKTSSEKLDLGISRGKPTPIVVEDLDGPPAGSRSTATSGQSTRESSSPADKGTTPAGVAAPTNKENSVYRIAYDGTVREVFRERSMILALAVDGDRLLIGTGGDGQLFEVRPFERERTELARLDHTRIHCFVRRGDGTLVLAAGDPGKLYAVGGGFVRQGSVLSEVFDAKLQSRWGSLRWTADAPRGTRVSFAVRSGNVAEPDETWSDWSEEQNDGETAVVQAPPARFLQFRVTLATDDPQHSPSVSRVAVRYTSVNVAPDVTSISVPDLNAENLENSRTLKIKWNAHDLNDDDLTYSLFYRKDGWKQWIELAAGLEKREYEWDTTAVPAGVYRVKVVASDRRDNSEEEALVGELVSSAFIVDHVAPVLAVKVVEIENGRAIVEATAEDGLTRLTAAAFAVDGKNWTNVFPRDGLFDRKTANFRFVTEPLKPGTHVLVLRVSDAAGNTASQDVVFEVPER